MYRTYLLIILVTFSVSCASKFTKVTKSTDNEYKLKMAENYYAQKKYNNAFILFEELFPVYKGTARFEDLYYKYALTSFYLKDYSNSENLFKTFVETFPNSNNVEEADYMRAYSFFKQSPKAELDQTNTIRAMGQMQVFINTHPNSSKIPEATNIINDSHTKLETKDFKNATLYYDMGYYKAAAIAFAALTDNYPDTQKGDEYKLMAIRSYFLYARNSITEKQPERFDKVIAECMDFSDRFPESKLLKTVESYKTQSLNLINNKNEQIKKAA